MSEEPRPLLAMVALSSERLPEPEVLVQAFKARQPDVEVSGVEAREQSIFLEIDGALSFVSLMPGPIPWGDLEGPCATSWWWPEASERMRDHAFHVVCGITGGTTDALDLHLRLTSIVAAVTEHTDAIGVYWGNGTVVHEAAAFREQAGELGREAIQPILWIDCRIEPLDEAMTTFRFFTTGLHAFDHPEIEIDSFTTDPDELFGFLLSIVDYVLTSGKTISPGETLGRTQEERIAVSHGDSMFDRPGPAMKLAVE